ncbi:acid methyltransferase, putative [Ixodes scapularis]|uniref:Acid methyltransferase, putative n=1 Tax=Ixodes scapularis TaxID=6945 RepID=B7P199_IXOSC|nr:acid methyltransferase, putative [Ixodes scapularis]|eukprot:XP_002400664.1 acid methyltransferase, putative [Ixodes scapularis]
MEAGFDPEHYERISASVRLNNVEALKRTKFRSHSSLCDQILDIGCGIGDFTRDMLLKWIYPCRKIVGIDISPSMLSYAKRNYGHPDICYDILDAGSSDVSAFLHKYGKFDRIYSFFCLNWIRDQKAAFRNISTLLKDDGECLLVFCAQFVLYNVWVEMSKMERWTNIIDDPSHTFPDTWHDELSPSLDGLRKAVRRLVADAGMTTLSCEVHPTKTDFRNDELLLGLLVPLVTVKTGTTEEDKDRMREELSAKLLDGCTRTPKGSSYPLDLFFVHAQKITSL